MKVWYVAYGTNLNEERFLCYINGGTPDGTYQHNIGCRDKTPAEDGGGIILPYQLYFAKSFPKWENLSVGFLNKNKNKMNLTLGRKYLISWGQFEDFFKQANDIEIDQEIEFLNEKMKFESTVISESNFGRIIFLGTENGFPIYTLTSYCEFNPTEIMPPSRNYLQHIVKGLRQTYNFSDEKILGYLIDKPGISNKLLEKNLFEIIAKTT